MSEQPGHSDKIWQHNAAGGQAPLFRGAEHRNSRRAAPNPDSEGPPAHPPASRLYCGCISSNACSPLAW